MRRGVYGARESDVNGVLCMFIRAIPMQNWWLYEIVLCLSNENEQRHKALGKCWTNGLAFALKMSFRVYNSFLCFMRSTVSHNVMSSVCFPSVQVEALHCFPCQSS